MATNPLAKLPIKKQRYAIALANSKGMKTKKECLLEAGYMESTSNKPNLVETEDFKVAFQQLLRKKIPLTKVVRRIREGMDAVDTQFFQKNGIVTDSRDTINWAERRNYTNMYAQMSGAWTPKAEIDHTQKIDEGTLRRMMDISDKLNISTLSTQQLKELEQSHVTIDAQEIAAANSFYDTVHAKSAQNKDE